MSCDNNNEMEFDFELTSAWDIYFSRNDKENWDERLVYVGTFKTVKEFWALYQHLKLPQHLSQGCDYLVFRSGVEPYWESEHNKNGGRWNLEIKKAQRNEQLNDKWLNTLLALIGEQLSDEISCVNGAMVQSRKQQDRISVWTRCTETPAKRVGFHYQQAVQSQTGLKFQSHSARNGKNGSMSHHRFTYYVPAESFGKSATMDGRRMNEGK